MTLSFSTPAARVRALAAVAALVAIAACDDSTGPAGGSDVAKVEVIVLPIGTQTTNLPRGITVQLLGAPANAARNFVDIPVTWSSSDDTRATVDQNGLVTTVGGGDVTISASAGGQTGTFDLNVQFPVSTVTVGAPAASIRQEGTVDLDAALVGSDGEAAVARDVEWSSSNEDIATVDDDGIVSGVADGTVTITATSEGVSGSTQVTVSGLPLVTKVNVTPGNPFRAIGQTVQMSHESEAASGNEIPGTTAAWSSSDQDVATVDANGLVTLLAEGTAKITATVDNGEGSNVTGSSDVQAAPVLANGAAVTVPNVGEEEWKDYAFVSNGTVASFSVVTTGGDGDSDMHIFAPGVVPAFNGNDFTFDNFVCRPWNVGSEESCTINAPAAG
ncbi:MAG: Ig-like domain-containing protein, partial [Gemmatimonadaceae bacterium]